MDLDPLVPARDAVSRYDWAGARDAALAPPTGPPELEAERADLLAEAAWWLGRLDECIEARERAYRLYDDLGDDRRAGQCAVWLYEHHGFQARPAVSGAWLRRARRSLEHEAVGAEHAALFLREAETAHGGGDLEGALALEAFDTAQGLCGRPCGSRALLRLAQGRVNAARSIIDGCLRDTPSNRLGRAALLPVQVHVAIAAGDLDAAAAAADELEEIVAASTTPMLAATSRATRGRLQLAHGDPAAAGTLQDAVDRWQALGVPYEVATARTLLGQALRDRGDEAAATQVFAAAAELFEQIGARADADLVLHNTQSVLPAGLTEREVEVLRLIAAGLTNNEIAVELYLSPKTISRHLSNIFTKIGVTSRAGATAFAFEHELITSGP